MRAKCYPKCSIVSRRPRKTRIAPVLPPMTSHVIEVNRSSSIDAHARGDMRAYASAQGLTVVGWVIGHRARVVEVTAHSSDALVARAPVDVPRPDIVEAFGDVSGAARSGFRIDLEPRTVGECTLVVRAVFSPDHRVELGIARIKVRSRRRVLSIHRKGKKSTAQWTVLSPPAERHKVLHGADGWLFLHRDPNDVIGQQIGRVRLKRRKRRAWSDLLRNRIAMVKSAGSVWLCAVIPDKNFVYPEHLSPEIEPAPRRAVHEFLSVAERLDAPVMYGLDDLQAAKQRTQLFPKTDTHWNHHGAYIAYRSICSELEQRGVAISSLDEGAIEWSTELVPGDLGSKLYPQATSVTVRARLIAHRSKNVFDNRVQNHGRVMIFEQDSSEGLTGVIFGESFVQSMLIFLKESFRRLVFVHTSMLIPEVLEAEQPDVVLSIPLERFLLRVPDDREAMARLDRVARRKVEHGRISPAAEPFLREIPSGPACGEPGQVGRLPWLELRVHDKAVAVPPEVELSRGD